MMQKQSATDTNRQTVDDVEADLKRKGFRQVAREHEVAEGTYCRSETTYSNPRKFEGPPSYTITWGEAN